MKKLLMSMVAGTLLLPGLAMAKDTVFTGEIMDSACAKGGGTNPCSRRWAPTIQKRVRRPA
jgi:hypothetical protein